MKKSRIATLLVFFLLIPATLFLGTKLPGRGFYITGTLIVLELMVPFFMAFEGRKPQARELVVIAVLCALAIAARVAIPFPHFKAIFAVVMISGIAFGPETGFMVGAISAFASNFFYGQGPFTPWQMMAYGAGGMLAGFCFAKKRLARDPVNMAIFGFFAVMLWVGPLMDVSSVFLTLSSITWKSAALIMTAAFPVNLVQGITTAVVLGLLGRPLLGKLERIQIKYGMMGDQDAQ
jgi:energy-coupling factor transport system substrate-specific component